jgi:hypothetical protein
MDGLHSAWCVKSGPAKRANALRWLASFGGTDTAHRIVITEPICVEPEQREEMPAKAQGNAGWYDCVSTT